MAKRSSEAGAGARTAGNYHQLYFHGVWTTFLRQPSLSSEILEAVCRHSARKVSDLGCEPIAIGGYRDHVHVLIRLNPTVAVAHLVSEVKGSSSHLVNQCFPLEPRFRWQSGYGAFSISKRSVADVASYVLNQESRHVRDQVIDVLERSGGDENRDDQRED